MRVLFFAITLSLGLTLITSSLGLTAVAQNRVRIDGVRATINDEVILDSDVRAFRDRLKQEGMVDEMLAAALPEKDLQSNPKAQLEYLIAEKILDSEIKRLGLTVTIERVEQEIRDIAKRNNIARADLLKTLAQQGISVSEYQAFIKTRIERQSLMEMEITSKIRVSDDEVLAEYLKASGKKDSVASEFTLAHIFFNPKKGGSTSAETRAAEALDQLKAGQSFETVAEQRSEDPQFTQGGILGTFKTGEAAPELEKAAMGLEVGQHSGVVKTKAGVHIIKLNSRKRAADPEFERLKDRIRGTLLEKAFQKQFKLWLETQREEAFIHITPNS